MSHLHDEETEYMNKIEMLRARLKEVGHDAIQATRETNKRKGVARGNVIFVTKRQETEGAVSMVNVLEC